MACFSHFPFFFVGHEPRLGVLSDKSSHPRSPPPPFSDAPQRNTSFEEIFPSAPPESLLADPHGSQSLISTGLPSPSTLSMLLPGPSHVGAQSPAMPDIALPGVPPHDPTKPRAGQTIVPNTLPSPTLNTANVLSPHNHQFRTFDASGQSSSLDFSSFSIAQHSTTSFSAPSLPTSSSEVSLPPLPLSHSAFSHSSVAMPDTASCGTLAHDAHSFGESPLSLTLHYTTPSLSVSNDSTLAANPLAVAPSDLLSAPVVGQLPPIDTNGCSVFGTSPVVQTPVASATMECQENLEQRLMDLELGSDGVV